MTQFKFFFFIIFICLNTISLSVANELVSFINVDALLQQSNPGKKIIKNLSELNEKNRSILIPIEEKLRLKEENIDKQKNIMSEDELKIKLQNLQKDFSDYKKDKEKLVNEFNNTKDKQIKLFFEKVTPIIREYVEKKNISIVLDKKNIFLASQKNNITIDIIKLLNENLK